MKSTARPEPLTRTRSLLASPRAAVNCATRVGPVDLVTAAVPACAVAGATIAMEMKVNVAQCLMPAMIASAGGGAQYQPGLVLVSPARAQ